MVVVIFILILLAVSFVVGMIAFLRSLILRKNIGCGLFGLLAAILPVFLIWLFSHFLSKNLSYQSKSEFVQHFETRTNFSYPQTGKIIEKEYQAFLNFTGDLHCAAIIVMDTLDYEKLLRNLQSKSLTFPIEVVDSLKNSSSLLKKRFSENECAYFYKNYNREYSLWFHKDKKTIVYELIDY